MVVVMPFSRTYYVFLPIIVPRTEVQKLVTNYKETMKCDGYKSKMDRCLSGGLVDGHGGLVDSHDGQDGLGLGLQGDDEV